MSLLESAVTPFLRVTGLSVKDRRYPGAPALVSAFELEISTGETAVILGDAGSGKTLLCLALLGGLPPDRFVVEGALGVAGQQWEAGALAVAAPRLDLTIGWLPTNPEEVLSPHRAVGAQLLERLPRRPGESRAERRGRMCRLLEAVGLFELEQTAARAPHRLSDAERQRVALALAFALEPNFVIADDPFFSLSSSRRLPLLELLVQLGRRSGTTLLLTTREASIAARFATQVLVICGGRTVERGTRDEVLECPTHPWTRAFLGATPRQGGPLPLALPDVRRPAPGAVPDACPFYARCSLVRQDCLGGLPAWRSVGALHEVRCPHTAGEARP